MKWAKALYPTNSEKVRKEGLGGIQITSVSRLEDENEEKLVEGMCSEYGSTGAAGSDSATLSLVFRKPRPNGHPIGTSLFWE